MSIQSPPNVVSEPVPIDTVRWREHVDVQGVVRTVRVRSWGETSPTLECTIADGTGGIILVFLGRSRLGGISLGATVRARGMVIEHRRRLVLLNPCYTLIGRLAAR